MNRGVCATCRHCVPACFKCAEALGFLDCRPAFEGANWTIWCAAFKVPAHDRVASCDQWKRRKEKKGKVKRGVKTLAGYLAPIVFCTTHSRKRGSK